MIVKNEFLNANSSSTIPHVVAREWTISCLVGIYSSEHIREELFTKYLKIAIYLLSMTIVKNKSYKTENMKFILNNIVTYFELSSQNLFNSDIKNSENTASSNSLLIIQCTSGGRKELISLRPPLLNSFPYDKNPSICWKVVIKRNQMMKIVMIKKNYRIKSSKNV